MTQPDQRPFQRFVVIVINCIRPYGIELNNVLGLPSGATYRCRYRRKWVKIDEPEAMAGQPGLVVARDFQSGQLLPMRRIQVSQVNEIGDIIYVEYTVNDLIAVPHNDESRRELVEQFDRVMQAGLDHPNPPEGDLEQLVFFGVDQAYIFDDAPGSAALTGVERWGNTLEILRPMQLFHNVDMLHVVRLLDEQDQSEAFTDGAFGLQPGAAYKLEVLQNTFASGTGDSSVQGHRSLELAVDAEDIRPIVLKLPVMGRYDVFRFRFRVSPDAGTKVTEFFLRSDPAVRDDGAGGTIGPIPDVALPARITVPARTRTRRTILVALGALMLVLFFVPAAARAIFPNDWQATVSDGALVVFILLSAGSVPDALRSVGSQGRLTPGS